MNVQEYIRNLFYLADHPRDLYSIDGGKTISTDSPCGKSCVLAIDAAASLIRHSRNARGIDADFERTVILGVCETCAVWICG